MGLYDEGSVIRRRFADAKNAINPDEAIDEVQQAKEQLGKDYQANLGTYDERTKRMKEKELMLIDSLRGARESHDQAVESQLDRLLQETGLAADQQRSQVGAAYADRGLNRSTMASRGIEGATLGELQQKGALRLDAAGQLRQSRYAEQAAFRKMEEGRQRSEAGSQVEELADQSERQFMLEKQRIEDNFNIAMTDAKLGNQEQAFSKGLLGDIFSSVFKIGGMAASGGLGGAA